jgi:hypothetical protein
MARSTAVIGALPVSVCDQAFDEADCGSGAFHASLHSVLAVETASEPVFLEGL